MIEPTKPMYIYSQVERTSTFPDEIIAKIIEQRTQKLESFLVQCLIEHGYKFNTHSELLEFAKEFISSTERLGVTTYYVKGMAFACVKREDACSINGFNVKEDFKIIPK